jgi:hypothetical protein
MVAIVSSSVRLFYMYKTWDERYENMQLHVTTATKCRVLTQYVNLGYVVVHEQANTVYRVYSVSTYSVLCHYKNWEHFVWLFI